MLPTEPMKNLIAKFSTSREDIIYGALGAFVGTALGAGLTSFVLYIILSHSSVLK